MTHISKIAPAGARATGDSTGTPAASCDLPARPIAPQTPDEASPPVESPTARYMGQSGERATLSKIASEDLTAEIVRLYRQGLSTLAIGRVVGLTSGAIHSRLTRAGEPMRDPTAAAASRLGLNPSPRRETMLAVITEIVEQGLPAPTNTALGYRLGWSRNMAGKVVKDLAAAGLIGVETTSNNRRFHVDGKHSEWSRHSYDQPHRQPSIVDYRKGLWPRTGNLSEDKIAAIYAASDTPRYEDRTVGESQRWRDRPVGYVPTETVLAGAG